MRLVHALIGICTALACGCKRESGPASKPPASPAVEVVADAAAVDAAREEWARRREQHLAVLLANPDRVASYDEEALELLRGQGDRAVRAFVAIRDDKSRAPADRLSAVTALRCLDVPTPAEQVGRLANADAESRFCLMLRFHDLYPGPDPEVPAEVRRAVVRAAADPEPRSYLLAADLAARAGWTEAAEPVRAKLTAGAEQPHRLRKALARLSADRATLDALLADLRNQDQPFGPGDAMLGLAEVVRHAPDAGLRRAVADALFEYLRTTPDKRWVDSNTWSAVAALAGVPEPENRRLLATLAAEAKWRGVREYAATELKRLDATTGPSGDSRPAGETRGAGPASRAAAERRAADACVRHGWLTRAAADEALRVVAERALAAGHEADPRGADAMGGLVSFLDAARRQVSFDTETGMVPNRHDRLLLEFAAGSAGAFNPEAAVEDYVPDGPDADTGKYAVQFVHGGKLYRFRPDDLGDWYDVGATVAAVNRALADAGAGGRFVSVATGDQTATFLFGPPGAVSAAGAELGVPLGDDPDAARKAGTAFEDQVLDELRSRGQ